MVYFYFVLVFSVSYFIGNITFARVISKFEKSDITKSGSGNPGTLNAWRTYGFWPGFFTFLLDMLKGVVTTLTAFLLFNNFNLNGEVALYVAGFGVILGHIFPVFFKFKGGKGIATSVGVFLVANIWVGLLCLVIMIISMLFIKYASICTISFVIVMSVVEICLCNPINYPNYIFICGILALVLFAHRGNIKRLINNTENKTELLLMLKGKFKKKN